MAIEILSASKNTPKKRKFVAFKLTDEICDAFKKKLRKDNIKVQHFLERVVQAYLDGQIK